MKDVNYVSERDLRGSYFASNTSTATLRWYTTTENFSDSSSIKMNFCHDFGGVPGTLEMIRVSKLLS